jgi:hypothetical protein
VSDPAEFREAWAVICRDVGWDEESETEKDVFTVLRVFWREADALAEVHRLRRADPDDDRFYYMEETKAEHPPRASH